MGRKPLLAIAVGMATLELAGCGSTKVVTTTETTTQTTTETTTQIETTTQTIARSPAPPAPKPKPAESTTTTSTATAASTASAQSFSGNGTKSLGTIRVTSPSVIQWTCSGCAEFAFISEAIGTHVINVGSKAASGTSSLDPGTYPDAQVISDGSWTIRIAPS